MQNKWICRSFDNDIAILELERDVVFRQDMSSVIVYKKIQLLHKYFALIRNKVDEDKTTSILGPEFNQFASLRIRLWQERKKITKMIYF